MLNKILVVLGASVIFYWGYRDIFIDPGQNALALVKLLVFGTLFGVFLSSLGLVQKRVELFLTVSLVFVLAYLADLFRLSMKPWELFWIPVSAVVFGLFGLLGEYVFKMLGPERQNTVVTAVVSALVSLFIGLIPS